MYVKFRQNKYIFIVLYSILSNQTIKNLFKTEERSQEITPVYIYIYIYI